MLLSDPDEIALLRIRLAEQARELAAMREAASDAAEAAAVRLRTARQDAVALRRALDEAQMLAAKPAAGRAEPEPLPEMPLQAAEAASVPLVASSAPSPRRTLRHAAVLPIWRLIRPIARPLLWRARAFFTADALRELAELRATQQEMHQATRDAAPEAGPDWQPGAAPPPAPVAPRREYNGPPGQGLGLGDTAAERWLLTVALESAQARDSLVSAHEEDAPGVQAA